jgi:hypothetical protein
MAEDDPRCLAQVVADADLKLALELADATETSARLWFDLLQAGTPFREVQQLARAHVERRKASFRKRREARR